MKKERESLEAFCNVGLAISEDERNLMAEEHFESDIECVPPTILPSDLGTSAEVAKEEVTKTLEDAEENPVVYSYDSFTCSCSEQCRGKFNRRTLICMVYPFRKMSGVERKKTASAIMYVGFVPPDAEFIPSEDGNGMKKRRKKIGVARRQAHITYTLLATKVCQVFFQKVLGLSDDTLGRISKDIGMREDGFPLWREKRGGKRDIHKESKDYLVAYLHQYANIHVFPSPSGRFYRGKKKYEKHAIIFLPSSTTKFDVWQDYEKEALEAEGKTPYKYSHFTQMWEAEVPWLRILKRGSDFCDICSQVCRDPSMRTFLDEHLKRANKEREKLSEEH
eukprot:TRINITY_DN129_c0_g1_i5.p2 TRINITY_DN129_c0_g1~~TRINITY_DN129_c0_g1_i5.p2  ORF type:complete len:335 (+),score=77.87 TRINITY_DN129_c0_g1_i5:1029-2033(+)